MSAYYDRIANAYGTPYTIHGTAYELRDPSQARIGGSLEDSVLALYARRANIARCCDGDDHRSQATLPDRYTTTLADALRWYAEFDAMEVLMD